MANQDYYYEWLALKSKIKVALEDDEVIQHFAKKFICISPQGKCVETVARVYCKYCDIFNKMCLIYDQTAQPQRQVAIKKVIDALTCRLYEIKGVLEEVEVFQYTYPENALQQMFMIPQDIEVMCPFFYPFEMREKELQYIVDEILSGNRLGDPPPTASEIALQEEERLEADRIKQEEIEAETRKRLAFGEELSVSEAEVQLSPEETERLRLQEEHDNHVLQIQRMERTRTVIREKTRKQNKDVAVYLDLAGLKKPQAREALRLKATQYICTIYRRFIEIKREHIRDLRLKEKLGMVIPSYAPVSAKIELERVRKLRRQYRHNYVQKWLEAHIKEKTKVFRLRKDQIMEDISDEIRDWLHEWYKVCKVFDEFPYPGEGGSILIVQGQTLSTAEFLVWREVEIKRMKKDAANPKTKEDIKAEKMAAREEQKRREFMIRQAHLKFMEDYRKQRLNPEDDPGPYITVGTELDAVLEAWKAYESVWRDIDRADAAIEAVKGHIMDIVTEDTYRDLHLEMRPIVDEMMRLELASLKAALKAECERCGVEISITQKRHKPRKPRRPKPEKIPPEQLFQVLVDNGIVRKYPRVTLDEYWGDKNYGAADGRAILWTPKFPPACIGDVVEQVRLRCLLPICSSCPNVEKTQLLVGPKCSGKKTLAYAVATETNSILIDLSPMNVYDKFPGKELKTMYMLVQKIARIMQPTVILVENADKLYYKKVPKEDRDFDPKRIANDFVKEILKPLKKEKILVIGTAAQPWLAHPGQMKKAFPSVILIPQTDYASISFILTKMLMGYHGINREFDVHSAAQVLRGYDIDSIKRAVRNVLHGGRLAQLSFNPLKPIELVNAVFKDTEAVCTDRQDSDMFWQWYLSYTHWGQRLAVLMNMIDVQLEFKAKLDKKKKGKKK